MDGEDAWVVIARIVNAHADKSPDCPFRQGLVTVRRAGEDKPRPMPPQSEPLAGEPQGALFRVDRTYQD